MVIDQVIRISNLMNRLSFSRQFFSLLTNEYSARIRCREPCYRWFISPRWMTTSKRVQDRSHLKRVHDLEIATERCKIASKILFLMDLLKKEPEQIMTLRSLDQYRTPLNLPKPHKMTDFIRKSPKLFELYRDRRGVIWCGMTKEAEDLIEEEAKILEKHADKAAEYVTRLLMMSVDKRLPIDKIAHFRRDFGLQYDFRTNWVRKYSELFRVVKSEDDVEFLELNSWNPAWAVTELEKKVLGLTESDEPPTPGILSLPFPMKFPQNYKKLFRYGGKIDHFQKRSYLSPYADARELTAGSQEFDKRAVAVMHEILSFTSEKRLVTDHLTHFRREFVMPQKLMRLLLKHFGIFYVSERGKRLSVFLTEAYERSELIEKNPLVLWKEKVQRLIGYRGRKHRIETFDEFSDIEGDNELFEENPNAENAFQEELKDEEIIGGLEEVSLTDDDSEMDVGDVYNEYKDNNETS